MRQKKVLSSRERETEKILQNALPEYVIRANVRLADVVHAGNQFKYMSGYHLDFVICDHEANTIAAVELDDATHDTEDGIRRDGNKNRWLKEAGIKLIRIREPNEANNIREAISNYKEPGNREFTKPENNFHEEAYQYDPENLRESKERFVNSGKSNAAGTTKKSGNRIIVAAIVSGLAIIGISQWMLNNLTKAVMHNYGNSVMARQQQTQPQVINQPKAMNEVAQEEARKNALIIELQERKRQAQREAEEERARIAKIEYELNAERKPATSNRKEIIGHQKIFISGKSAKKCAKENGGMNDAAKRCTKGHYESRPIYAD